MFRFVTCGVLVAALGAQAYGQSGGTNQQRDPNRLWCAEHGVYEDECTICHPELADRANERDPNRLWCAEHGVYEDECTLCHPELADRPERVGRDDLELWCNEHRIAERECGICQPQLAGRLAPGAGLKVRLPSQQSAQKAGIRTSRPRYSEMSAGIDVFCEVRYNQNRAAKITPLAAGVVHRVHADVGDTVEDGELLVEIASPDVAAAKRDFLTAIVDERLKLLAYEREKELLAQEISAAQAFQEAEARYEMARLATRSARQRLINFGFTEPEADEVAVTKSSDSLVHLHAPFSGTLVARSAVLGEAVETGQELFTLADLSTMWLSLSIPESKVAMVRRGLAVEARFAALSGVVARGELAWIRSAVTEPSRMVEARAVVDNPGGLLRDNLFGEARILLADAERALTVPSGAVQRFDQHPFVFVALNDDLFELRRVELGVTDGDRVQVVAGLGSDDAVVVVGSYTMMSEFLKSRLGAGCVHD